MPQGSRTDQDRVVLAAQAMALGARRFAGDPPAGSVGQGHGAVQRQGGLERHPGTAARLQGEKTAVQPRRFFFKHAADGFDAGVAQNFQAAAADFRVGIADGADATRDAGLHKGRSAGRLTPLMAAWLQRHIGRGAARLVSRVAQGRRLGVESAEIVVPAAADHFAVFDDHAADHRVGRRFAQAAQRQIKSLTHVMLIGPLLSHARWMPRFRLGSYVLRTARPSPGASSAGVPAASAG